MDTLVIVRKIREAEALAESGKHRDARRLLEPLLSQDGLSDSHKSLVTKKIEVFDKQLERATRVMSRRAASSGRRDPNDDTDLGSGRKPAASPQLAAAPKSSGDTTVERPAIAPGTPTEAVPRPRDKDTTKLRKKFEPVSPGSQATPPERDLVSLYDNLADEPRGETTVRDRPSPVKPASERRGPTAQTDTEVPLRASEHFKTAPESDLQRPARDDLAPLQAEPQDIRIVDSPLPPGAPTVEVPRLPVPQNANSREIQPEGDDGFDSDEMPALGEVAPVKAAGDTRGVFKALPPKPPSDENRPLPEGSSVRVQDTRIAPPLPPPALERSHSARSSKDLTSMVERLPDDDLRKELALEVVRLREELERARSGRRDTDRTSAGSSRRIAPGEKPESSIFKIPSNRVNTIVRTAAGTSDITAHMPTRDEVVPELEVLRRDSLKKPAGTQGGNDARMSLAKNYIESARLREPDRFTFVAAALGLLVIVGLVAWAIYRAVSAMG